MQDGAAVLLLFPQCGSVSEEQLAHLFLRSPSLDLLEASQGLLQAEFEGVGQI